MDELKIREAFTRVKEDLFILSDEISKIKTTLNQLKIAMQNIEFNISTVRQINPSVFVDTTDNPTFRQEIKGLKATNLTTSTGNKGASTDRQTDISTDTSTYLLQENIHKSPKINSDNIEKDIQEASEILNSLDNLKKQIRIKFKRVTRQEMAVFSTIYQLEEQGNKEITYPQIAKVLNLSESSIRDYIQRIISKGIPLKKEKLNNKKIILSISPDLKKIATLSTIISLREL